MENKLKEKQKQENEKRRLKLIYKRKFVKSLKANNYALRFRIDLETKNKVLKICDKNKVSVSKFLRDLILKELKLKEVKNGN